MFHLHEKGIKLSARDLFLDARRVVDFSFVSHGHSDHLRNHKRILATPATAKFYRKFFASRRRQAELIELPYHQKYVHEELQITLYPAGHILGSAMILIEQNGQRLLYTGDFKLHRGKTAEAIEIPEADVLIMESTYGLPEYDFGAHREELPQKLRDWIDRTQRQGYTPVVLAYALGKAQEAMAILEEMDCSVRVYPQIWELAQIYGEFGIQFERSGSMAEGVDPDRDVIVMPPAALRRSVHLLNFPFRTMFLSGWATSPRAFSWVRWDDALPFSDHADFDELIEFVFRVNPKKVYTLHGFPEFAEALRKAGYDAEFLGPAT